MKKPVIVKQAPEKEVPAEILAESITSISQGIKKLRGGRLNDAALFLLIQHASPAGYNGKKVSIADVRAVFNGIDSLETIFLKKKTK